MTDISQLKASTAPFDGYEVEKLVFYGDPTRVYRARRKSDGMPVMLKALRGETAARQAAASLQHEFEITRRLQTPGVVRPLALEYHRHMPVVVFEDFGGDSLNRLIRTHNFSIEKLVEIGIQVTRALMEIHGANIIHKDINPSNIVCNPENWVVKIIDFGISTYLTREQAAVAGADVFEGSLPYISPEQTGRMNRAIDYRTDFYSLGATFYELLTGQPMFSVSEPIEWFHCHIARQPRPPAELNPKIPRQLSDIVMKLLAKTAEDRYQSALGIRKDLKRCLDMLHESGNIEPFALARGDVTDRFQIPQRLYGRSKEVKQLLDAFGKAGYGSGRIILVSGYSGIGKTCLIKEIYKPVTERRGFFVSGKFDQLQRNMPYRAMVSALRDLVRQLLTEPEDCLLHWRDRIIDATGVNARLMIDVIGELALVTGPLPEVPPVPPTEAEQRFHRTFQRFIQVFCRPEHPMVVFLDDLQWADSASLRLIDLLIDRDSGVSHLLLIGAYRDNEVQAQHQISLWLAEKRTQDAFAGEIRLQPLTTGDLTAMVADTLGAEHKHVAPLAELVSSKTGGNPFFSEEFLKALYEQGLIWFSTAMGGWTWDIARIQEQQLTDNVVELMTAKLRQLPAETLQILELAACIGFRFSLRLLAMVSEKPPGVAADNLQPAVREGLIAPIGDAYQLVELELMNQDFEVTVEFAFAHDRIQQAAYFLLAKARRPEAHLRIGRLFKQTIQSSQRSPEQLFEMTNHLNLGSSLINEPGERLELCRLNIAAGQQARQANAYAACLNYFKEALNLLDEKYRQSEYELTLEVYSGAAEAAYLCGAYDTMDELVETGLLLAQDLSDKVAFYLVWISACMARGQLKEAIDIARPLLASLGHHYPARPGKLRVLLQLARVQWRLRGRSMEELRQLPLMTDPGHLTAMQIGERIGGAAMFTQTYLLPLMILKSVETSLDHGLSLTSLTSFTSFGMILAENLGQVERGDAFGRLGINLPQRLPDNRIEARVHHIYNGFVRHWKEPVGNCFEPLHDTFKKCLENGDFEYAAHAACVYSLFGVSARADLRQLFEQLSDYQKMLKPLRQGPRVHHLACCMQFADNMQGNADDPAVLQGRFYDIAQMLPLHSGGVDKNLLFTDLFMQMQVSYHFGRHSEALEHVDKIIGMSDGGIQNTYLALPYFLMDSLIRLANLPLADKTARRQLLRRVKQNHSRLKRWARLNPANASNKERLIKAGRLQAAGRDFDAHRVYDQAIGLSRENGFVSEEAMAWELCAIMHVTAGRMTMAEPYLVKARERYDHWGAEAKVRDLERCFPWLADRADVKGSSLITLSGSHANVDIGALIKALKTIAEETVHSRMVEVILSIAMQFAGAQHGMLLLRNQDGQLFIEAEASSEGFDARILQSVPVTEGRLSQAVVNYVARTRSSIVINDAGQPGEQIPGLVQDPHIQAHNVRSVLCLPLLSGSGEEGELIGMIYLENNLATDTFTRERFGTLEIIGMSAAGRLELSRKAVVDGLTELFNHDYFQNLLIKEFESARRHGLDLALILIDIDNFKVFNDTWGHQLGDQVLREVARLIRISCRQGDTVARYGGEEMTVILPMADLEAARLVAERIRLAVDNNGFTHGSEQLSVTISLGVAVMDSFTTNKDILISRADAALYRSKANGRNQTTVG